MRITKMTFLPSCAAMAARGSNVASIPATLLDAAVVRSERLGDGVRARRLAGDGVEVGRVTTVAEGGPSMRQATFAEHGRGGRPRVAVSEPPIGAALGA